MYLIIYDITENNIRNKISKLLIQEGYERIQFSVFVGFMNPYNNKVWSKLKLFSNKQNNDSILCLRIKKQHFLNTKIIGKFTKDLKYLTGDKSTLII